MSVMDSGLKHAGVVVHGRTVYGNKGCNDSGFDI